MSQVQWWSMRMVWLWEGCSKNIAVKDEEKILCIHEGWVNQVSDQLQEGGIFSCSTPRSTMTRKEVNSLCVSGSLGEIVLDCSRGWCLALSVKVSYRLVCKLGKSNWGIFPRAGDPWPNGRQWNLYEIQKAARKIPQTLTKALWLGLCSGEDPRKGRGQEMAENSGAVPTPWNRRLRLVTADTLD